MLSPEQMEVARLRTEATKLRIETRLARIATWLRSWEIFKLRVGLTWMRFQLWLRGR